jgi:3-carboxy-cis,cis-muconate cycloisomerase
LLSALAGDDEIEALLSDEAQLRAIVAFEIALADADADAGLITREAASAIAASLQGFMPDWSDLAKGIAQDGVVVPALLRQLRHAVGAESAAALHFGATSQDAIDTALVLQLSRIIPILGERLTRVQKAIAQLSATYGNQPLMAHTRMQAARPFTVAAKLRTWIAPVDRHAAALAAMRRSLLVIQLGGPIGDRSSFAGKGDEVARGVARRLDLGLAESWQSAREPIVALGSLLSMITGSLGKLGADLMLMAQTEIAAVVVRGGGGSSAMPHKANPIGAELLVTLARYNAGLAGTLHQALVHENERSGAAWTLEWLTLPDMLITAGASLRISADLLGNVVFPSGRNEGTAGSPKSP